MKEITFELTNYCPHHCKFCSSNAIDNINKSQMLETQALFDVLNPYIGNGPARHFKHFDRINLSGGEPLAHQDFYFIYNLCKEHADDVVVYSNLITHRRYNAQAIDGVYVEADITVTPETDKINILRRVKQGKELNRPEVHLSRNHFEDCACKHRVVRPDGTITKTPCNKYAKIE